MKSRGHIFIFGVTFVISLFLPGSSSGMPLEDIVTEIQDVYQGTRDFTADFVQESTLKSLKKTQVANGKIYFKNPGKLRWDYIGPTKQAIVTDGETLWMYLPEDKQVIINKLSKVYRTSTSTFFLMGMGNLKRDFDIEQVKSPLSDEEKSYSLKLVPKEQQSNFNDLFLLIDKKTFLVGELYFNDFYGNFIRIKFKNSTTNQGLSDSVFLFNIPEDVEIVEPPQIIQNQ